MNPSYLSQSYHALTEIAVYQTIYDYYQTIYDYYQTINDQLPDHKLPLLFITISQRPFTKPQRTDYQAINDHLPDHDRPFYQIVRDHFYQVTNYHLSNHKGPVTGL